MANRNDVRGEGQQVIPFPYQSPGVNRASRHAVKQLVLSNLISELVATSSLEDMGATDDEIELVRTLAAVVRRRP
jgi:hypothetical protein